MVLSLILYPLRGLTAGEASYLLAGYVAIISKLAMISIAWPNPSFAQGVIAFSFCPYNHLITLSVVSLK